MVVLVEVVVLTFQITVMVLAVLVLLIKDMQVVLVDVK